MPQCLVGKADCLAILGKDGSCKTIGRSGITKMQSAFIFFLGINIDGQDRAKDLFAHRFEARIGGFDHSGFHVVSYAIVTSSTKENFCIRSIPGIIDVPFDVVKACLIDHRIHEVAEVLWITNLNGWHHLLHFLEPCRIQGIRDVHSGSGTTLLSLIFECSAQ
ncbi:hypothetical protein DSECCO2_551160 [anaerobic digester metagenome]